MRLFSAMKIFVFLLFFSIFSSAKEGSKKFELDPNAATTIDLSRFPPETIEILNQAFKIAQEYIDLFVRPLHVSFIAFSTPKGMKYLTELGLDPNLLHEKMIEIIKIRSFTENPNQVKLEQLPFSNNLDIILTNTLKICKDRGLDKVYDICLFRGMLQDAPFCRALKDLRCCKIKVNSLIEADIQEKVQQLQASKTEDRKPTLHSVGRELVKEAKEGNILPIIGRNKEIRQVIEALMLFRKPNAMLLGDPGVGKTAVIEGIAYLISKEALPEKMNNYKFFLIEVGNLMSGTAFRGEMEKKIGDIIIEASDPNVVLVIDEIHLLLTSGKTENSMGPAELFKPALSRKNVRVIGATTHSEFSSIVMKDPAFVRRFVEIHIPETSKAATLAILKGNKRFYEDYHKVFITEESIKMCVQYAEKYMPTKRFPDKALNLMDRACAKKKISLTNRPDEIDDLEGLIDEKEVEASIYKSMTTAESRKNLEVVLSEIEKLRAQFNEKNKLYKMQQTYSIILESLKEQLENNLSLNESDPTQQTSDNIVHFENEINRIRERMASQNLPFLTKTVDPELVALIVSQDTGMPLSKISEGEAQHLMELEELLSKHVIGQENAVSIVSNSILRSRAGLTRGSRPIASILCLGKTGVGKTELAKAIAREIFGQDKSLIRFDMSEYSDVASVNKLIGSSAGYVGYDEGGQLTEAVRIKPFSVLLFDEIEKAEPKVLNVLLQVMDDGRLTDGRKNTVDFSNTIIILTSNVGAEFLDPDLFDKEKHDFSIPTVLEQYELEIKTAKNQVIEASANKFSHEFLNRLTTVVFNPLCKSRLIDIFKKSVRLLSTHSKETKLVDIKFTDAAVKAVVDFAYEPMYGARPLERFLDNKIVTIISKYMIIGNIKSKNIVNIDYDPSKPNQLHLDVFEDDDFSAQFKNVIFSTNFPME